MRTRKLTRLMLRNVVRSRRTLFFSSIGVIVGIAILIFFVGLGYGVDRLLRDEIFPTLPPNEIEVVPAVFATGQRADAHLTEADRERIKKVPGVLGVFARHEASFPGTAYLDVSQAQQFFQKAIPQMDLFVDGVSPALVGADRSFFGKKGRFAFHGDAPGKPIPVVVSNALYGMYLTAIAPALKLPVFSKQTFIGFRFNLRLGVGITRAQAPRGRVRERIGEIVGFSNYANRAGITIPARYVELYNREYTGPETARRFKSLIVRTASAEDKAAVTARLRELNFRPQVEFLEEQVFKIVTVLALLFLVVAAVIVLVSAIQITHTFFMLVYERKNEIGVLRALGATRGDIRFLIVSEAFCVGLAAGGLGLGFGYGATLLADKVIRWAIPTFSRFQTESFFVLPSAVVFGALGFAALFCVLGAALPARQAARMEPARALEVR